MVFKFFKRNPEITLRKPENMDRARAAMSSRKMVDDFFPFLHDILTESGIKDKPHLIFNCDETGWSGKEAPRARVIGARGGHVYRRKVTTGDHVTAHLCISADGRFLPTMIIYKNSLPHRQIHEGIPDSWHFGHSENGYMDRDLFSKWFHRVFVPNCGRERPVILIMDNHDSHISTEVVKTALQQNIRLVGLPGHTTHILQPLDVKVISPLKDKVQSLAAKLGFLNSSLTIGRARLPLLLKYAIDQTAPATVVEAFAQTVICHYNPESIDRSQIIEAVFEEGIIENEEPKSVTTCETCGSFLTNPLVSRGLIPQSLAEILVPPPTKPMTQSAKRTRMVTEGRLISTHEILKQLMDKEEADIKKKEEAEKRKEEVHVERRREIKQKEYEERKRRREDAREERREKKQQEEKERLLKKQRKNEEKERRQKEKEEMKLKRIIEKKLKSASGTEIMAASLYECSVCKVKGTVIDEISGIKWFGCDEERMCGRWFRDHCSVKVRRSICWKAWKIGTWFCHVCKPWLYEE